MPCALRFSIDQSDDSFSQKTDQTPCCMLCKAETVIYAYSVCVYIYIFTFTHRFLLLLMYSYVSMCVCFSLP